MQILFSLLLLLVFAQALVFADLDHDGNIGRFEFGDGVELYPEEEINVNGINKRMDRKKREEYDMFLNMNKRDRRNYFNKLKKENWELKNRDSETFERLRQEGRIERAFYATDLTTPLPIPKYIIARITETENRIKQMFSETKTWTE